MCTFAVRRGNSHSGWAWDWRWVGRSLRRRVPWPSVAGGDFARATPSPSRKAKALAALVLLGCPQNSGWIERCEWEAILHCCSYSLALKLIEFKNGKLKISAYFDSIIHCREKPTATGRRSCFSDSAFHNNSHSFSFRALSHSRRNLRKWRE